MKTIYSLILVLLLASSAGAQTNVPPSAINAPGSTNPPTTVPIPRRNLAARTNVTSSNFQRTLGTNVATTAAIPIPAANASAATNAAPPAIAATNQVNTAVTPTVPAFPQAPGAPAAPARTTPTPFLFPPATNMTASGTNKAAEVANIHYDFQKMDLEQILGIYSELIGRTLLRGAGLQTTLQITLKTQGELTRSEAVVALETVLAMNGVTFIPIGDKFSKVVVEAQAGAAGGSFSDKDEKNLPDSGRYITQIVQLKYAQGQEVQQAISYFAKTPASIILLPTSNTLILRDYSENVKRMLDVINRVDTVTPLQVKPEVIPIKYALSSDIATVLSSLTTGGAGVSVGSSGRSARGVATTPGGFQPGAVGTSGIQGQANNFGNQQQGQSALGSSATRGGTFQRNLQNIVSRISAGAGDFQVLGEAKIINDDRTNSLLIFADDQDMIMIKDIISRLDVVLAQVLIEAIIMEVSLDDSQQFGISYLQQPQKSGNLVGAGGVNNGQNFLSPKSFLGTNGNPVNISDLPSGFSYFGSLGNDLDVAVAAFANDSRVNVLSRPRIQTSHAVPATLFVGDTVPYITGTSYGNLNGVNQSQYQEKRVGITLDVLPLINPDGLVVMDIQENIQQLGTTVIIDGNPVPTTTERDATAKVAVRDRETIILGGFISTSKTKSKSGVPYLKDIPGLGVLFRSSSDSTRRVELIILLRPTVLPSPESAALVAATERDKLPGIKQGEYEIREMERKRQEAIDAEMRKKMGLKTRL